MTSGRDADTIEGFTGFGKDPTSQTDPDPIEDCSASFNSEQDDPPVDVGLPSAFGRYEVRRHVGAGGFSVVYLAYDGKLDREVAVKVPAKRELSQDEVSEFLVEARNLAKLSHPGILSVHDVGVDNGVCYIVTELVEGLCLHEWLDRDRPSWQRSAEVVANLADALAHAHARRTIHRDIKPANIIMTPNRGPVLIDFGLSISEQLEGEVGLVAGTPAYMSPEQLLGKGHRIDGRTDIYSLGVVLYALLCGQKPFRASAVKELRRQILEDEPQPPRQLVEIPEQLERICLKAMAKRASDRYTTASDMAKELRALFAIEPTVAFLPPPASIGSAVARAPAGERQRRYVTLMYIAAELVAEDGASGVDLDDQAEATARFDAACREVLEQFSGTILRATGFDLLVCFGYPVGCEDAARRAVHSGLKIHQALDRLNVELQHSFGTAISFATAIHSGSVVVSDSSNAREGQISVVGDTVNLVTRLERDHAREAGELLVTGATRRLIAPFFRHSPVERRQVKGVSSPVELYRIEGAHETGTSIGLQDAVELTPLIGRDQEVGLLLDRWARVKEGLGQLVLLIGDAGLGKSRLLHVLKEFVVQEHVAQNAAPAAPPIIEWRCSSYHRNSGFYPAIEYWERCLGFQSGMTPEVRLQLLKAYVRRYDLDPRETVPLLGSLLSLPDDEEFPPLSLSSQRQKQRTIEIIADWLDEEARRRPVIFIVEDLHWVDPSTLELLTAIANQPIGGSLLCLLTFRPDFSTPWTSQSYQTQIALNRLTRPQIHEMLRAKSGLDCIPDALIDYLAERTDGVPLFVEEIGKTVMESDALQKFDPLKSWDTATWSSLNAQLDFAIPDSLQGLLMARLDRVTGSTELIQLAATIGREFSHDLMAAASGLDDALLSAELDKLVKTEFLYRTGRAPQTQYTFKHALIQDAAYDSMLKRKRQASHLKIANTLLEHFPSIVETQPELQAHHYTRAGLHQDAANYWEKAGVRSTARSAHREALGQLNQALNLLGTLEDSPQRDRQEYRLNVPLGISTLSVRGYAAPELGAIYERRYELCEKLNDALGRLHATWALSSWRIVRDEMDLCLDLADRIMNMAEPMQDAGALMEALFIRVIVLFYRGNFAGSLENSKSGFDLYDEERCKFHASRTGQNAGVAHLAYMALSLWHLGYPDQALQRMEETLHLAESLNHPFSVAFALHHFGWLNNASRRGVEAQQCGQRQIEVSVEHGFFFWQTTGILYRAGGLAVQGEYEQAKDQLLEGLEDYAATGAELGLPYYYCYLARAYCGLGQYDEAKAALTSALAAVEKSNERFNEAEIYRLMGELALAQGGAEAEAEQCFERSIEIARRASAKSLELRATTDLSRLWASQHKKHSARERLGEVFRWFTEGFETPDLLEAAAVLKSLDDAPGN